jgi:hypothetical protein
MEERYTMVVIVKIAKNGQLLQIKEIPDTYRDKPYNKEKQ